MQAKRKIAEEERMEKANKTTEEPYNYYIGLDVGSTTAKIAVLDDKGNLVYHKYERHNAQVNNLIKKYFAELLDILEKNKNCPN